MKKLLFLTLVGTLAVMQVNDALCASGQKKNDDKGKKKLSDAEKRAKRTGTIPTGMEEGALLSFLKDKRKEQSKKSHDLKSWYTMLVANTSTQPISVKYKSGWTAEDVVIVVGVSVAVTAAVVATGGAAGVAVSSSVAGNAGAVAGGAAAGAVAAGKLGKHTHVIAPGTYRIFHRPETVQHVRMRLLPATDQKCSKAEHIGLNVSNKNAIAIISGVSANGCTIEKFTIANRDGKVTKTRGNTAVQALKDSTKEDADVEIEDEGDID